jgi:hypothetical protein
LSSRLLFKSVKIRIYKTIIFPVALYGREILSLTFREERRLRVSENRVLRLFGLRRDEMTGSWGMLHNEELHNSYSSPSIIIITKLTRMRQAEHVARMGIKSNVYRILLGKPE